MEYRILPKIAIPQNSKFDSQRAIELANLVERAYQQYDTDQREEEWKPEITGELTGSDNCKEDLTQDAPTQDELSLKYSILSVFKFTGFWNTFMETVPFGFIAKRGDDIFIVFRGTREKQEWYRNFDFGQREFLGRKDLGLVSIDGLKSLTRSIREKDRYFVRLNDDNQLEAKKDRWLDIIFQSKGHPESLAETIDRTLKIDGVITDKTKIFITGHSLGGALATMAMLQITTQTDLKPVMYTFASPRTGNSIFAKHFYDLECFRVANSEDIVPTLPLATGRFVGEKMFGIMSEQQRDGVESLRSFIGSFISGWHEGYEHIGEPLYFTQQKGSVSLNHNMSGTYREAIPGCNL
ncbi:MAG: lipase family protein [Cyanobacteria bacterium J06588_4]